MTAIRTLGIALGALSLAGCTAVVSIPLLDDLNRELDARTVLVEPEYSLYSPFDPETTQAYRSIIEEELASVTNLFAVSHDSPIVFILIPVAEANGAPHSVAGGELAAGSPKPNSAPAGEKRIAGFAGERLIAVAVDGAKRAGGEQIAGRDFPEGAAARRTIRHELAHVCLRRLGLRSDSWFEEGVAEVVEHMPRHSCRFGNRADCMKHNFNLMAGFAETVAVYGSREAAAIFDSIDEVNLADVLAWEEYMASWGDVGAPRENADLDARFLAMTFVYFLLESSPEGSFRARLRAIDALSDESLRAAEPAWKKRLAKGRLR